MSTRLLRLCWPTSRSMRRWLRTWMRFPLLAFLECSSSTSSWMLLGLLPGLAVYGCSFVGPSLARRRGLVRPRLRVDGRRCVAYAEQQREEEGRYEGEHIACSRLFETTGGHRGGGLHAYLIWEVGMSCETQLSHLDERPRPDKRPYDELTTKSHRLSLLPLRTSTHRASLKTSRGSESRSATFAIGITGIPRILGRSRDSDPVLNQSRTISRPVGDSSFRPKSCALPGPARSHR